MAPELERLRRMRFPEVSYLTGLKHSSIYDKIKTGQFPKPVLIGVRNVGWVAGDIEDYLNNNWKPEAKEAGK